MATVIEGAFDYLDAPPSRLTLPDIPIPYSRPLEQFALPGRESIADAARRSWPGAERRARAGRRKGGGMRQEIPMPTLSEEVEEGVVVTWFVAAGGRSPPATSSARCRSRRPARRCGHPPTGRSSSS